jgi:hypothetical protein
VSQLRKESPPVRGSSLKLTIGVGPISARLIGLTADWGEHAGKEKAIKAPIPH